MAAASPLPPDPLTTQLVILFVFLAITSSSTPPRLTAVATAAAASTTTASKYNATLSALLDFKKAIYFDPTRFLVSWNTSTDYCTWPGIVCSDGTPNVAALLLDSNQLEGTLTPMLGDLPYLSYLNVSNNSFHGPIPSQLGNLATSLTQLDLSANSLTGSIPNSLANCTQLQYLDLRINSLSSKFPSFLSTFTHLALLDLSSNLFIGNLPSDIGLLSNLQFFQLYSSSLHGSIPASITNCTNLVWLHLDDNELSGPLPSDWSKLANLQKIKLQDNSLMGSIPATLEYGNGSLISTKADVYSYGVLLMELVMGMRPTSPQLHERGMSFHAWARTHQASGRVKEELDEAIQKVAERDPAILQEVEELLDMAVKCTSELAKERPTMKEVRSFLLKLRMQRLHDAHVHRLHTNYTVSRHPRTLH